MIIKLVRHGQSTCNAGLTNPADTGDKNVHLTDLGWAQARQAGKLVGEEHLHSSLIYYSPFLRTRQTLDGMLSSFEWTKFPLDQKPREDARLREISYGYCSPDSYVRQHLKRATHGWYFYKFENGESPAMVYDRCSDLLGSIMRRRSSPLVQTYTPNLTIIGHGTTNRCFLMRFMHLTVEQFETMQSPPNCGIITIAPAVMIEPQNRIFTSPDGKWACTGDLPMYEKPNDGSLSYHG